MTPHRPTASTLSRVLVASLAAMGLSPCTVRAEPALPPVPIPTAVPVTPPALPTAALPRVAVPALEPDGATASGAGASPFSSKAAVSPAAGQVLAAPVTVNANSSADAMTVTQTSSGRAITGSVTSTSNSLSAIKGQTAGSGAGLNGVNTGTTGNSGKFQSTNASSTQPGVTSTTAGTGSAIVGVMTNTGYFNTAAVLGQHNGPGYGIGVEGDGGYAGVYGYNSSSGYAGYFNSAGGVGIRARTGNPSGSYAGIFDGPVFVTGSVSAASYNSSSDRAVKQDFRAIDAADILQRIDAMPIGGWDFKATPGIHHVGPMAQDFRAAFGLGVDDKHIDMTDGLGVSLAAIQALKRQLDDKNALIAELKSQFQALRDSVESRTARADAADATIETLAARLALLERGQAVAALPASPP